MMKKAIVIAAALLAAPAAAHEVWVERDATGPARIYLGEPADPVPAAGDPEFPKLQKPQLVGAAASPALTRRANHIEAAVAGAGDVRVRDDTVFAPWDGEGGKQGAVFYARAGRSETAAKLDLELVPVAAQADRFTLMFRGKPLPAAKVTVISPERWQKSFETDAAGALAVPELGRGRYLLSAAHTEKAPGKVAGQDVASVMHISTLTFVR
jgi:uncharacterized GH25 family protein